MNATMALNAEKNGIEIRFAEKPETSIRDKMKAIGFKWYKPLGFWCAKQTDERLALAKEICGAKDEKPKAKAKSKAVKATAKAEKPKATRKTAEKAEAKAEAPAKAKKTTKKTTKKTKEAVADATAPSDFQGMTEAEIAETVSKAVGVPLIYDKKRNEYIYSIKKGKFEMTLGISHYSSDGYGGSHKKGDAFISVGYQKNYGDYFGCHCPCNSIDSAVKRLKEGKKYMEKNVA